MLTAEFIPSIKVKHAKETTDDSKVWFDYWLEHTKEDVSKYQSWHCECCNHDVPIDEMVGAHVIKADNSDDTVYIYPTCATCNNTYKEDKADTKTFSVPATELIPTP